MTNTETDNYIKKLNEVDIQAWLNGKKSYRSTLFDLMSQADSHNLEILDKAYPFEIKAFLDWRHNNGLAK